MPKIECHYFQHLFKKQKVAFESRGYSDTKPGSVAREPSKIKREDQEENMMSDLPKQDPSGPESCTRSEEGLDQGTGYEECCNVHEDSRQASIARIWQPQVDHKTEAMECLQCHGIFETRSKYKSKRKHFCKFLGVKLEKQPEIDVTSQSVAMTCSICRFVHF